MKYAIAFASLLVASSPASAMMGNCPLCALGEVLNGMQQPNSIDAQRERLEQSLRDSTQERMLIEMQRQNQILEQQQQRPWVTPIQPVRPFR